MSLPSAPIITPVTKEPSYWPLAPAVGALAMVVTTVSFLAPLLIAISNDLGVTLELAGALVVTTTIPWALVAPFSGLLSDRLGRRPVILAALSGMGLATILGAFATEFWTLMLLRFVTGIFGSGGPPTIMAGLIDYYPPQRRGTAIGWSNTSFSFASLIGVPLVGAIGGLWGWRMAFLVTGVGLLVAAVFIRLGYPAVHQGGSGSGNAVRAYGHLFRLPQLGTLLASNLCERVTFMVVTLYLASFLIQRYLLTPVSVAPALALVALGAITGALTGGFLADRLPRASLAALSLGLSGLFGVAVFVWPAHLGLSILAGFAFGLTNAASRPPFIALVLGLTDQHRGALNGLIASSNQIGWAIGAGVGGLVLGLAGYGGLGLLVGCFASLSAGLVLLARPKAKRPRHPAVPEDQVRSGGSPEPAVAGGPDADGSAGAPISPPGVPSAAFPAAPADVTSEPIDNPADWLSRMLAAEQALARSLDDWSRSTADGELAEALEIAAARARDRAFRLRRALRLSDGSAASPPQPELDLAGGWPTPATDRQRLRNLLDRPASYAADAGPTDQRMPDQSVGDLLQALRESERDTRELLREQLGRLGRDPVEAGMVRLVGEPTSGVDGTGVLCQVLRPARDGAPALVRIAQPPTVALRLRVGNQPCFLVVRDGRGVCRPDREGEPGPAGDSIVGDGTSLSGGRVITLSAGIAVELTPVGAWPLTYLVIGSATLESTQTVPGG